MSIRPHRSLVALLLVLGTLATVLAAGAWWVNRDVFNTTRWTATSAHMIASPVVRRGLSRFLVARLFGAGGVDAVLEHTLGPSLGGDAARALRRAAAGPANVLLSSRGGRAVGQAANREAISELLAAAGHPARRRAVALELTPLLTALLHAVLDLPLVRAIPGHTQLLALKLPPVGRLRALTPVEAHDAASTVRTVRTLAWAMPLAALASFLLAWLAARGWRTAALRRAGYGVFLAGLVVIGLRAGLQYPVAAGAGAGAARAAVRAAWLIAAAPLRAAGLVLLITGAAVAACAWLARLVLR